MDAKDKDASCFSLDGVVAEMVIEVEDHSGLDDFRDLTPSPNKSSNDSQNDKNEIAVEITVEQKDDQKCLVEDSGVTDNKEDNLNESSNQNLKKKRKRNQSLNENGNKLSDGPRYSGRKRKVNKKYISEDVISGKRKRSESVQSKEAPKGVKKLQTDVETEVSEVIQLEPVGVKRRKTDVEIEVFEVPQLDPVSKIDNFDKEEVDLSIEEPEPKTKQDVLSQQNVLDEPDSLKRKLPFRKNRDAPDVPDLKPKVFWWNGVGEGLGVKLGDIQGFKERIVGAKSLRALFRVLFFQWPTNGQDLIDPILKFNGFPFDKKSYEFTKRQSMMKIMLDATIANISEILGLKKGSKSNMISDILNFLIKPHGKIDFVNDPSMQPVVLLEKLVLDNAFFDQGKKLILEEFKTRKPGRPAGSKTRPSFSLKKSTPGRTTRHSAAKMQKEDSPVTSSRLKSTDDLKTDKSKNILKEAEKPITRTAGKKKSAAPGKVLKTPTSNKSEKSKVVDKPKVEDKSKVQNKPKVQENQKVEEKSKAEQKSEVQEKSKVQEKAEIKDKSKVTGRPMVEKKSRTQEKSKVQDKPKVQEKPKIKKKPNVQEKSKNEKISDHEKLDEKTSDSSDTSDSESDISKKLKKKIRKLKKKLAKTESLKKMEKKKSVSVQSKTSVAVETKKSVGVESKKSVDAELKKSVDAESKKSSKREINNSSNDSSNFKDDSSKEMTVEKLSKSDQIHEDSANIAAEKAVSDVVPDSSETESADESKIAFVASPRKISRQRIGKPLIKFPQICESIRKATFTALQRLHILMFGASDKAENLKGNILAFGGFPFLEGSDEWKQKHFLLSLLAQNNLREYLNLLCIESTDEDQPFMINKLMRFLAAPTDNSSADDKIQEIETEVVSSELINKSPVRLPVKEKPKVVKKKKKPEAKKTGNKHRKVLMSEEEARRLEANFAREQRAIAREANAPPPISRIPAQTTVGITPTKPQLKQVPKPPITDPSQLNALLQTVYKRRALKEAGAVISLPNKGERTKLGLIENIKFLVVTSNYRDLDILHRLIFMSDAVKSKIRKNILDFDGFNFNEDSEKYKLRIDFLNGLGHDISKRISFLLGLCPLQTNIPQQDLNELIMYFLMSPCKTKQVVPITQMPADPDKNQFILMKPLPEPHKSMYFQNVLRTVSAPTSNQNSISSQRVNLLLDPGVLKTSSSVPVTSSPVPATSTPVPATSTPIFGPVRQKARKSISTKMSPVKKVLLPPSVSPNLSEVLNFGSKLPAGTTLQKMPMVNPVPPVSTFSTVSNIGLNTAGKVPMFQNSIPSTTNVNQLLKLPVGAFPGTNMQVTFNNSSPSKAVLEAASKIHSNISGKVGPNPVVFSQAPTKLIQSQNILQTSQLPLTRMTSPQSTPQEFIVQQQTPDGQQKTFKLIRLPSHHPLASAVKPTIQQSAPPAVPQQQPIVLSSSALGSLPPGIIVMKNPSNTQVSGQNLQTILVPINKPLVNIAPNREFVSPNQGQSAETSASNSFNDSEVEILSSSQDGPPSDDELFSSIQEIILSSNFEDITLRNVIERVSAQFSRHDLTQRHNYMKECVKKIIIGTS